LACINANFPYNIKMKNEFDSLEQIESFIEEVGCGDLELYYDNLKESYGVSAWGVDQILEEFSKHVVEKQIYID